MNNMLTDTTDTSLVIVQPMHKMSTAEKAYFAAARQSQVTLAGSVECFLFHVISL